MRAAVSLATLAKPSLQTFFGTRSDEPLDGRFLGLGLPLPSDLRSFDLPTSWDSFRRALGEDCELVELNAVLQRNQVRMRGPSHVLPLTPLQVSRLNISETIWSHRVPIGFAPPQLGDGARDQRL